MIKELLLFTQNMDYADIVSTISFFVASIIAFIQIKYSKTQNKLNRIMIEEKENFLRTKADISANLMPDRKIKKIRIYNKGNEGAKNVICEKVSSCKGWNFTKDTFEFLDEGKFFTIHASRSLPCDNRCTVKLTWEDSNGEHEKEVILSP